jgi:hypothetical protein
MNDTEIIRISISTNSHDDDCDYCARFDTDYCLRCENSEENDLVDNWIEAHSWTDCREESDKTQETRGLHHQVSHSHDTAGFVQRSFSVG